MKNLRRVFGEFLSFPIVIELHVLTFSREYVMHYWPNPGQDTKSVSSMYEKIKKDGGI